MVGMSELVNKLKQLKKLLLYKRDLISNKSIVGDDIGSDILRYIVSSKTAKTQRQIVSKFSPTHERTIRRYIDKLIKNHLVKRTKRGREVVYSARLQQD